MPIALFLVFTVLTLALKSKVISTAMFGTAVNTLTRHLLKTSSSCDAADFPLDGEESLTFYLKV